MSTYSCWSVERGREKGTNVKRIRSAFLGRNKHASAVTWVQVVLNYVVSSGDDGTVKLWDLNTGDFIRNLVALESIGSGGKCRRVKRFLFSV